MTIKNEVVQFFHDPKSHLEDRRFTNVQNGTRFQIKDIWTGGYQGDVISIAGVFLESSGGFERGSYVEIDPTLTRAI